MMETTANIDLARGWPSPRTLPTRLIAKAAASVLADPGVFEVGLQYGDEAGYGPLREELSRWLSEIYSTGYDANRICITAGASLGLANILQSYTEPTITQGIWIVAPCYHLACPIFEDAGFHGRLHAVPEGKDGIDIEWLRSKLELSKAHNISPRYKLPGSYRKFYKHIIYAMATCANPSGKSMPMNVRAQLVQLARKHDALIISDDVYDILQWPVIQATNQLSSNRVRIADSTGYETFEPVRLPKEAVLPRFCDYDACQDPSEYDENDESRFGHAVSNGSFSKVLGPGLRTGWVEGTPAFVQGLAQTGSTVSGGSPSQFAAVVIFEIIRSGEFSRHIDTCVRPALQWRHGLALSAVQNELVPLGVSVIKSSLADGDTYGGYFLWLALPTYSPDAKRLVALLQNHYGVLLAAGNLFEVTGDCNERQFSRCVRLCFAWETEERLLYGIRKIAEVLQHELDQIEPSSHQDGYKSLVS